MLFIVTAENRAFFAANFVEIRHQPKRVVDRARSRIQVAAGSLR